jgi:hypothetical protein
MTSSMREDVEGDDCRFALSFAMLALQSKRCYGTTIACQTKTVKSRTARPRKGAIVETTHDDSFVGFAGPAPRPAEQPQLPEQPVMVCSTYEENRQFCRRMGRTRWRDIHSIPGWGRSSRAVDASHKHSL